jgi:hypothetical protein
MLALCAAAIACIFSRIAGRLMTAADADVAATAPLPQFSPGVSLALHLDRLRQAGAERGRRMGLMLVSVHATEERPQDSQALMERLHETLSNVTRAPLFRIDGRTFALADCRRDIELHFEKITATLTQLRTRAGAPSGSTQPLLSIGAAIAEHAQASTGLLLASARLASQEAADSGLNCIVAIESE